MNNIEKIPVVLVVDDEPVILGTFKAILAGHFKVLAATNGEEALERVIKDSINLVFLDINLPGMNGIEILRRIKEYDENLPVVMVTATENINTIAEVKRLGVENYIAKPFDAEELINLSHKIIEKEKLIRPAVIKSS